MHIFDDQRGRFGPLVDRRSAFDLRFGAVSQRVRIETALCRMAVGLYLDPLLAATRYETDATCNPSSADGRNTTFHVRGEDGRWRPTRGGGATSVLLVSGRWVGDGDLADAIARLDVGQAIVDDAGDLVAAHLEHAAAQRVIDSGFTDVPDAATVQNAKGRVLLSRPWHGLDALPRLLLADLQNAHGGIHVEATVHRSVVIDDTRGPVGVAAGATVGPLAVLEGPCWIGPDSRVSAHAHIRPNTVVSEVCKVGGEIGGSIVYPYSNKGHAGYLGDSIVGSWCNFGAGTTVSNLKNTYGEVRVQLAANEPAEGTGRTFQGPILGDFVRTAIGTRLLTGSCISTGCCIAVSGFAPKFVPAMTFLTDEASAPYELESFLEHTNTAMTRREQSLSDADIAVLRRLASR